jgi:hypothetical protein
MTLLSMYYLLVAEIIPMDQDAIPRPKVGDKIIAYGVWVQDTELAVIPGTGWHEIHPVRYAEINGVKYGKMPDNNNTSMSSSSSSSSSSLFDGIDNPSKFIILDEDNPYRLAKGTVMDVYTNYFDGDYHVHILVEQEYENLLKSNLVIFPYAEILRLMSLLPVVIIFAYVIVTLIRPRYTLLGRVIFRRKKSVN